MVLTCSKSNQHTENDPKTLETHEQTATRFIAKARKAKAERSTLETHGQTATRLAKDRKRKTVKIAIT